MERTIPQSSLKNQSIQPSQANAYNNALSGAAPGTLWHTDDTIYIFGAPNKATSSLAAYNVITDTWQDVEVTGGAYNFGDRTAAQSVSISESGLHFIYGGSNPYMGGMIRFDASDSTNLSWTNETLGNGSNGVEVPNLNAGALVHIPAGEQGILVSFGGSNARSRCHPLLVHMLTRLSGNRRHRSRLGLAV